MEPNDTILLATELDDSFPLVVFDVIGDNPDPDILPTNDVDLFAVSLNAGDILVTDINAETKGSTLDSVLRVFDANGRQLVVSEGNSFIDDDGMVIDELDPFTQFTVLQDGIYYVGVSSSPNLNYNPNLPDSGEGESSGSYDLVLSRDDADIDDGLYSEPNDIISSANAVELDSTSSKRIIGEIGDNDNLNNDVDLFEVSLKTGDTLFADINAEVNGSPLDAVLTVFDVDGNRLAWNDDNSFNGVTERDSFQEFIAPQDGTYYVGVSSKSNDVDQRYDPTVENSNLGASSGAYLLELSIDENDLTEAGTTSFTTPINRFQNSDRPGTYLFAGERESQNIRENFPNFVEEGQAFKVAVEPGDDLIRINRFQNSSVPGTYLYAGEEESQGIRANFPNFIEEGIAFYVYDGAADIGEDFYRFQNLGVPGTYIFVAGEERQNILNNFPEFKEEGIAFKVEL